MNRAFYKKTIYTLVFTKVALLQSLEASEPFYESHSKFPDNQVCNVSHVILYGAWHSEQSFRKQVQDYAVQSGFADTIILIIFSNFALAFQYGVKHVLNVLWFLQYQRSST